MPQALPSSKERPRFVNSTGNVLDPELVSSIRKQAQLPDDAQIHDLLSHQDHNILTVSAIERLYDFEEDASLPWLALILDNVARSTYELARHLTPLNIVKHRQEKTNARSEPGKLLRDIRRLRTSMHLNCNMEDETRVVSPSDTSSTAGKVDLELVRLEYELDPASHAMDVSSGDVTIDLPPSIGLLCTSILKEYKKTSGKKSALIENAKLFQFDIETALGGKTARYSNVRRLHNGLQKLYTALSEGDERVNHLRKAVMLIDGYEQMFADAIYDLRMFGDRRSATRSNKELSDALVSLLNDIARVQSRLSDATELSAPPNELLQLLVSEDVDLIITIHRLPMRTGREPDSIRLRQLITELRYWHVKLTGESRSFTLSIPDTDTNIPEFTTGPFFNFVKEVSGFLNLVFDDNTLRKVISQARHDEEGTYSNQIMTRRNKLR